MIDGNEETGPKRVAVTNTAGLEVALSNALLFASKEANRPILCAVMVTAHTSDDGKQTLQLVATDSYTLVVDSCEADGVACWPAEGLLLDRFGLDQAAKLVKAAAKVRDFVTIEPQNGSRAVVFAAQGQTVAVRTVDGDYPDWPRLIETKTGATSVLFKVEMLTRLSKLRAVGRGKPCVELTLGEETGKPARFEVLDSDCWGVAMPAGKVKGNRWS